ncbi:cupin domain-containing protein [Bailinhaonella thermotolerans]|uniref:Cupin domain-containing protein n=1 Tax=Bailinhaonella thermotolerans TaxID=1070861 RepID=A0A3A4B0A4_9ACTN|nr:cupin domain-containing protein [Bailinhaonella thermotolerans]RJL33358.1 cupin domain-containing protein [Bailinhaonella thermotolerans]
MNEQPIDLTSALATFDQFWSPRIVTRVNDYDVRIAKAEGEHIWHVHDGTDEFFLVLSGELTIGLRDGGGEREVVLPAGSVYVVPKGVEHRPVGAPGTAMLLFEPTGTLTVGDRHEEIPETVDATTGHALRTT